MRNSASSALEVVCAVALTVIAFTVVILLFPSMKSADVASWVQAIGSIAAILGAYFVGERQARASMESNLRMHRIALKHKNDSILAIATAAKEHARAISTGFAEKEMNALVVFLTYDKRTITGIIDALDAIPLHELGSFEGVAALMSMKEALIYVQEHVERALKLHSAGATTTAYKGTGQGDDAKLADVCSLVYNSCGVVIRKHNILASALAI